MPGALQRKVAILVNMDSKQVSRHVGIINQRMERLRKVAQTAFKVLAIGAGAAAVGLGFIGKSVIQTGLQFEKFRLQLNVLFKSAKEGEKQFDWIKRFATQTPFELPQVVAATIQLKAFGLSGQKWLKDIGDLAAGMQQPLDFVADAFGRLASGQTGEAFEKFRRLGITTTKLMEEGIRFTTSNQLLSTPLQALEGIQRIVRKDFPNMMLELSKTTSATITNIGDAWTQMKAVIAEGLFKVFQTDLESFRDRMFEILKSREFKQFATDLARKVQEMWDKAKIIIPKIWNLVKTVIEGIVDIFKPVGGFLAENPNLVKNAAIVLILTKAFEVAKDLSDVMKRIGILGLTLGGKGSLMRKVAAQTFGRIGGGVLGGAAAGGTGAVIGAATAATTAALVPIIIGVLATAAVAGAVFLLVQKLNETPEESKQQRLSRVENQIRNLRNRQTELSLQTRGVVQQQPATDIPASLATGGQTATGGRTLSQIAADIEKLSLERESLRDSLGLTAADAIRRLEEMTALTEDKRKELLASAPKFDLLTSRSSQLGDKGGLSGRPDKLADSPAFLKAQAESKKELLAIEAELQVVGLTGFDLSREQAKVQLQQAQAKLKADEGLFANSSNFIKAQQFLNTIYEKQLGLIDAQERASSQSEQNERLQDLLNSGKDLISQFEFETQLNQDRIVPIEEYFARRKDLETEFAALRFEIMNDEVLSDSQRAEALLKINEKLQAKLGKENLKAMKVRAKLWSGGLGIMMDASQKWARGELQLGRALRVAAIQNVSAEVTGWLNAKAKEWAADAIASAARGQFGRAAGLSAAAIAAGAAAAKIDLQAKRSIDAIANKESGSGIDDDPLRTGAVDTGGIQRQSGIATRGVENVFIQPSVTFQGETVIVGDSGLSETAETIGQIAVRAVRDAIDTGELSIGT